MLGWEFPPRRSGGLGTACQGIAEALGRLGTEVLFLVPDAVEAREGEGVQVRACGLEPATCFSGAPIPSPHPPGEDRAATATVSRLSAGRARVLRDARAAAPAAQTVAAQGLRMLRVASPLRPYQTAAGYTGATAGAASSPYGPDLASEVERYSGATAELAVRHEFDVVHAHDWMTLPAALLVRELTGKPIVWHVHSTEWDRNPEYPDPAILGIEQLGLREADRIVAVSRYTAGRLAEAYDVDPRRVRVVHNAVTPRAGRHGWTRRNDRPLVLFLGRLTAQKGPSTFLRAAARVLRGEPRARFILAGSGDLYPQLVREAEDLNIGRSVHFTGFLEGEDVERMFAIADVYVMPSLSEPFGISALEAMSADVPVIVPKLSGVAEVVRNALKVESWDVDTLADRILALLKYPALREDLIRSGREEVRDLRWDVRARALLGIYQEVAA